MDQKEDLKDVVVIGSCMVDLICYTPRLPASGETIKGSKFILTYGGKGSNQFVATKKLGAKCLLIAKLGNDYFGVSYYQRLEGYKEPMKFVKLIEGVSTGMAQITVSDTGENHIVVIPGANDHLTDQDILDVANEIKNSKVLLCQLETPESTVITALKIKSESGNGKSILNVSPAQKNLNPLLFTLPDILCMNETEAEILTGLKVTDPDTAEKAIKILTSKGCKAVLITLGEQGAAYGYSKDKDYFIYVPAISVTAIDTTGAGDAFLGALAFYLATEPQLAMKEIIKLANRSASISVQRLGTQDSFPTLSEIN